MITPLAVVAAEANYWLDGRDLPEACASAWSSVVGLWRRLAARGAP